MYLVQRKKLSDETRDLRDATPSSNKHDGHQAKPRRFHVETRNKANTLSAVSGDSKEQKNISCYRRRHLLFLWYTSSSPSVTHKGFSLKFFTLGLSLFRRALCTSQKTISEDCPERTRPL